MRIRHVESGVEEATNETEGDPSGGSPVTECNANSSKRASQHPMNISVTSIRNKAGLCTAAHQRVV